MRRRKAHWNAATLGQPLNVLICELPFPRDLGWALLPEVVEDSGEQYGPQRDGGTPRHVIQQRELQVGERRDEVEVPISLYHGKIRSAGSTSPSPLLSWTSSPTRGVRVVPFPSSREIN